MAHLEGFDARAVPTARVDNGHKLRVPQLALAPECSTAATSANWAVPPGGSTAVQCGAQAAVARLWSPEGRRAHARGRLEPQVASAAAAGTARLSLLAALQPVAGHRCAEGHGSEGPVESGQPDGAAQRVEV